jgi:hypothetical protein
MAGIDHDRDAHVQIPADLLARHIELLQGAALRHDSFHLRCGLLELDIERLNPGKVVLLPRANRPAAALISSILAMIASSRGCFACMAVALLALASSRILLRLSRSSTRW